MQKVVIIPTFKAICPNCSHSVYADSENKAFRYLTLTDRDYGTSECEDCGEALEEPTESN